MYPSLSLSLSWVPFYRELTSEFKLLCFSRCLMFHVTASCK